MDASDGRLTADVRGRVGKRDGVLVLKAVDVQYRLVTEESQRETVEKVHGVHLDHCPVAQSIVGSVEISTSIELVERSGEST